MVTIVEHNEASPSYFYIDNDNELSSIPKCNIDSKAFNLTDKGLWVLKCCTGNVHKWHKCGTNQEVSCGWIEN